MSILYVVKSFGQYHFFKSEDERQQFIGTLPEWESKFAEVYEMAVRGKE